MRTLLRLARICLLLVGPVFLLVAAFTGYSTRSFVLRAGHTAGTITALEPRTDQDGETNYYPHFLFNAPDGSPHTIVSSTGTNPPGFQIGQKVNVLFDPADPNKAQIDSFIQLWFLPLIFGSIGCVLLALVVGVIYVERRLKPHVPSPMVAPPIEPI